MTSTTIIVIVVVILLSGVIFGLAWLAYTSCLKSYRVEVSQGKHDDTIRKEYCKKRKKGLVGVICSYLALFALTGLFAIGLVYKVRGENFSINNETVLVIKSGSMSKFFDEQTAAKYDYDTSLQFGVGDICVFTSDFELEEGKVYGYKANGNIITHRLIQQDKGFCQFCGDANPIPDTLWVPTDQVIYQYTGRRTPALGSFILFAQSPFGIWSIAGIIGVTVGSEIIYHKVECINQERYKEVGSNEDEA